MLVARNRGNRIKYSQSIFGSNKNVLSETYTVGVDDQNKITAEKKQFVTDVVNLPEFDPAFEFVEKQTMNKGSKQDQENIAQIKNKKVAGNLCYDDIEKLYSVSDNVFKYVFSECPPEMSSDGAIVWGILFALAAIIMRIAYLWDESPTLKLYMPHLNPLPIIITFVCYPKTIVEKVSIWLDKNLVDKRISVTIVKTIENRARVCIALIIIVVVVWLLLAWLLLKDINFGNDLLAVLSLFVSVFSDKILGYWIYYYENEIYHNGRRFGG